ncbi:hypothetical protein ACP275_08G102600 [Erythranthe tilingii]
MDSSTTTRESSVPPGFRFHPTDEELVGYYLRKKVASQKIDLDVIRDIDLYRIEPWDLIEKCRIGYEEQKEWYFFSHKDKKYPTGTRTNRATIAGFWKATGRDKAVYDRAKIIGMRKTLVFYKGRAPNGQKTDWIMHEYRLESQEHGLPQEEGWVVCRAFKKRATGQTNNKSTRIINEGWDSTYYYDEPTPINNATSSVVQDDITRRHRFLSSNQKSACKQEIELVNENLHFLQSSNDQLFVQLPQLESPSLPPIKRDITNCPIFPATEIFDKDNDEEEGDDDGYNHNHNNNIIIGGSNIYSSQKKVSADWRELDKFVASQLSHDIGGVSSSFESRIHYNTADRSSDLAGLLLLQTGREEDANYKLNQTSTSDCDIGICIFNK